MSGGTLSWSILTCTSQIRSQNRPQTTLRSPNGLPKMFKKCMFYSKIDDFEVKTKEPATRWCMSGGTLFYSILTCTSRIRSQNRPQTSLRSQNGFPKILKKSIFYSEIDDFEVNFESPQRGEVCPVILYLTLFWAVLLESGLRIGLRLV